MALIRPIATSDSIDIMHPTVTEILMVYDTADATINVSGYKYAIIGALTSFGSSGPAIVDIQNGTVLDSTNTVTINAAHDTITVTHGSTAVNHFYNLYS